MIDNKKLDVRIAREKGRAIYMTLTGYLEKDKKYVVEIEKTKRVLNNGESFVENKVVIQALDEVKRVCQNWNEIKCEDCDSFGECELNKE